MNTKKTNKSKKSLTILAFAIITLAFFAAAVFTACSNPLFPGAKKSPNKATEGTLSVTIVAALESDGSVTITAEASGEEGGNVSYQWYSNSVESNDGGTIISGETQANYKPPVSTPGTTYYYVKATNALGGKTYIASSNTVGIIVYGNGMVEVMVSEIETPAVTIAASSDGSKVTLTAAASVSDGGELSYQWYRNTADRSDGGTAIAGETKTTYTPPVSPNGTSYYYVKATNTLRGQTASAVSHTVRVTIQDGKITEVIVSETVETPMVSVTADQSGGNVTLTASASVSDGGTLSYRWYKNTGDSGKGGTFIAGATGTTYTPPTATDGTAYYYVRATNTLKGQTASAVSNTVRIIIQSGEITEVITSKTVETPLVGVSASVNGANVTITASASVSDGGTLTYQWYQNTVDNSKNGAIIAGATGTTYTPPMGAAGSTTYYYVKVTNSLRGQVVSASSNTVRIIVQIGGSTEVVISDSIETPMVRIAAEVNGGNVTITATATVGDGGTLSYLWYRSTVDSSRSGEQIAGATGTTYTPQTNIAGTTYYYVKVTNTLKGQTASALSNILGVVVPPEGGDIEVIEVDTPEVETPTLSVTGAVDGRVVTLTATASVSDGGALTYQWYRNSQNNATNGEAIAGATGRTYSPPTDVVGTIYYYCIVTNTLIGQTARAISNIVGVEVPEEGGLIQIVEAEMPRGVTVSALPVGPSYAIGATVVLTATASVSDGGALSYQWYSNAANNKNGTLINGGTGTTYIAPTNTTGTVYYYVIATNTLKGQTASASSNIVEVTVAATPINSVGLLVIAPVKSQTPNAQAITDGSMRYTAGTVEWIGTMTANGVFAGSTVYTARVTLTANTGYAFAANFTATINGSNATISDRSAGAVTLSLTFTATLDKTVTGLEINTQPNKLTYYHGEPLDVSGLTLTVTYDNNPSDTESGTYAELSAPGRLGTNLSTNPAVGNKLSRTVHNLKPVEVNVPGMKKDTSNLTVNTKELTLTFEHTKPYDTTTAANNIVVILNGVEFSDDVSVTPTTINSVYTSASAGTDTITISTTLTLTGNANEVTNYTLVSPTTAAVIGGGITKKDPVISRWPWDVDYNFGNVIRVDFGTTLSQFTLESVSSSNNAGAGVYVTPGVFAWTNPSASVGNYGPNTHSMTFTPTDTANYNTLTKNFTVYVRTGVEALTIVARLGDNYTFQMGRNGTGSGNDAAGNVTPVHQVTLNASNPRGILYMAKYEMTQKIYEAIMGTNPSAVKGDNLPVTNVSWYDAIVFCNRLSMSDGFTPMYTISGSTNPDDWGPVPTSSNTTWNAVTKLGQAPTAALTGYSLPTEAQWEFTAKGGVNLGTLLYSASSNASEVAWYNDNSGGTPHAVGTKKANQLAHGGGIYDLTGNVAEWCWDRYGEYTSTAVTNPTGATSGTNRVVRGGHFNEQPRTNVYRTYLNPSTRNNTTGFRVVRHSD